MNENADSDPWSPVLTTPQALKKQGDTPMMEISGHRSREPRFSRIRAVLFDFDGTLVDTMGGFTEIAADVLNEYCGLPPHVGRARYLETSGLPFCQQIEMIVPGGKKNEEAAEAFERRKLTGFFSESFHPDTRDALCRLRGLGYKVAVSSNNGQALIERFVRNDGTVPFDLVLGFQENFAKGKDHFEKVMETWELEAHELLFVGDSLMDAKRACACAVPFVGILGTFDRESFEQAFPDVTTIGSLGELATLLPGV